MNNLKRPILRYHGGKWKLARWIIDNMPPHRIYVEPFGGAASVLLQKPRVYAEVYNDLDGEVVNVMRVMRDPDQAAELERLLRLTPFARDEFTAAYEPTEYPVERARRCIVRSFMGFGSAAHNRNYQTGFRGKSFRSGTAPSNDWRNYPDCLRHFTARLQGVAIESRQAVELIQAHDRPDVLFYVDPPYVRSTRCKDSNGDVYAHEMDDAEHEALAEVLHGVRGGVMISGYRCDLYDRLYPGWRRMDRAWRADKASPRTESLWFNPAAEAVRPGLLAMGAGEEAA